MCLLLVVVLTRPRTLAVGRRELGFLVVAGVVGIGVVQWFYFTAISRLPVGIALLLEYLAPVFVALWVCFGRGDPVRPGSGARSASASSASCSSPRCGTADPRRHRRLAGLAAAVSLAIYYLTGEHGLGRRDPVSLAMYTFGAAALFWMVLRPPWTFDWSTLGQDVALPGPFDGAHRPAVGAGGVEHRARHGRAVPAGARGDPPRRVDSHGPARHGRARHLGIVAWVVLSESLEPIQLAGGAVVLVGIVIAETARVS